MAYSACGRVVDNWAHQASPAGASAELRQIIQKLLLPPYIYNNLLNRYRYLHVLRNHHSKNITRNLYVTYSEIVIFSSIRITLPLESKIMILSKLISRLLKATRRLIPAPTQTGMCVQTVNFPRRQARRSGVTLDRAGHTVTRNFPEFQLNSESATVNFNDKIISAKCSFEAFTKNWKQKCGHVVSVRNSVSSQSFPVALHELATSSILSLSHRISTQLSPPSRS